MHPDVPRWALDVLERELSDVPFTDFVVLKDGTFQKLAVGRTPRETFIVQKSPSGGELYRVTDRAIRHASDADDATRQNGGNGSATPDAPELTCPACATTFRYWRMNGSASPVYCFNCGSTVRTGTAPADAQGEVEEHAAHAST